MLQTGENILHRRVAEKSEPDFPVFKDYRADGMMDYIAIINRFAPENAIGEMDCIYSSWLTSHADGSPMRILQRSSVSFPRLRWPSRRPRLRA
jgi:adenylate cyclase